MAVKPVPEGYQSVIPYLSVANARAVIDFMKQVFDAQELRVFALPDGTVMNGEYRIGDSVVMVAEGRPDQLMRASLYVYLPEVDSIYHRAMATGARSLLEPTDQFYGDRNAGIEDPSGNQWWLATHIEDVSDEELARRVAEQSH